MKHPARKTCNNCNKTVAVKNCIRYNTILDYVTVRGDDITTYANMEDSTTPYKLHYCRECWDGFWGDFNVRLAKHST